MNNHIRNLIFERFAQQNPDPKVELDYNSAFELLVAVVLSAQSTDVGVNKATAILFKVANTPEQFVKLGEEGLMPYIRTIGLYRNKAHNIIGAAKKIIEDFNGEVPNTREALMSLPGVGRKSANVILNTWFHQPCVPVDTHVFRVSNRTKVAQGETPLIVEEKLLKYVDKKYLPHVSNWLVLHGRYICIARKPKCPQCIIKDLCEYSYKTQA